MTAEKSKTFPCFGTTCAAWVIGDSDLGAPEQALGAIKRCLLRWHQQFTRFDHSSALCQLNGDLAPTVHVSSLMARFVKELVWAASFTDGLVDGTLLEEIKRAGYEEHHETSISLTESLALAPARVPGTAHSARRWETILVDTQRQTVTRPAGVKLDGGGIVKGMFADLLGDIMSGARSYAIDCGGDLRLGGRDDLSRPVIVMSPFDGSALHQFAIKHGAVATSGIAKRSWLDRDGRPGHHLLNPATGQPAYTGVVQVTALAPTALEAETRAKAAILSGPDQSAAWLPYGGTVVYDDGAFDVLNRRSPEAFRSAVATSVPRSFPPAVPVTHTMVNSSSTW